MPAYHMSEKKRVLAIILVLEYYPYILDSLARAYSSTRASIKKQKKT